MSRCSQKPKSSLQSLIFFMAALPNGPDASSQADSACDFQAYEGEFRLVGPYRSLVADGVGARLPAGGVNTLASRAVQFFAHADHARPLVGVIPFERDGADCIFQPDSWMETPRSGRPLTIGHRTRAGVSWSVRPVPDVARFKHAVQQCVEALRVSPPEALRKVVLSRCLDVETSRAIDAAALLAALCEDRSVTAFRAPLPDRGMRQRTLVGATPELLVSLNDGKAFSHPLAGSSRRFADPVQDRESGERLLRSGKDRKEHAAVVEAVMDGLAPFCSSLIVPEGTALRDTDAMWHLGTRIVGTLKSADTHVGELVAALHPTPAVCGMPREAAMGEIRKLEPHDRGFYAGAIGWMDSRGNGEWFVTLRCAELCGTEARLYAGAGIVAESDPASEADETSAKFVTMLSALGIDEAGSWLKERAA
jgi:isochorismate synthase